MRMIKGTGEESFTAVSNKYGKDLSGSFMRTDDKTYKLTLTKKGLQLSNNGTLLDNSEIKGKEFCIFFKDGKDTFSSEYI